MQYFPELVQNSLSRIITETFRGYDHRLRILPGQWYEETNLTAAHYPLFSQRAERGFIQTIENPLGMLAKDALMWIDGSTVYYNGLPVNGVRLDPGLLPKQMISMGAYAVIFPDKVYINTQNLSDCGSLDAMYTATGAVRLVMCKADGSEYENVSVGEDAPLKPENGAVWVDTSSSMHVLKIWSEATAQWAEMATVYVRIEATGIGVQFEVGDGIEISGLEGAEQLADLNAANVIEAKGDDFIVVTGLVDTVHTQDGGLVVERSCPDMDYVCESNNRIWGCKYGFVNGQTVNEIYACKLGDPKNWRCYAGLSTDSYAVSVGTDGKFTGAAVLSGYPLFFKENCIHKVYGSMPSNYQMTTTMCRGVQDGAWRSLNVVNEVLYYQSRTDIVRYDGSLPEGVSDEMGGVKYHDGVAGSDGAVYYISMCDDDDMWSLFTYDTEKQLWHREDMTRALCFANLRGDLVYIDAETGALTSASGRSGEREGMVEWSAESGIIGYEYPYSQYLSRFTIRAKLEVGATMTVCIEYDSEGGWIEMGTYTGTEAVRSYNIPVIPRRCDHMRLKISGYGDVKIYQISRFLEGGSEVWR